MHADLQLALELADLADAIALPRFRADDLRVDTKPDLTPVTDVDRSVERALRARLAEARPEDAVLGEEEGASGSEPQGPPRRWVLDPIDGTRNYARGIPVWFTLVALEEDGRVETGVASAPALGRRWWARRGEGAFANGEPIRVSAVARVEKAVVSYAASSRPYVEPILRRAWHPQPFSDAWAHLLVAEGAVDASVEHALAPWDIAALVPIVEEAGGRCTDLAGVTRIDGGTLLTTNGLLHEELLAELGVGS
ncbi:MAG TPA: inositol monophosphatase family protein [Gaiellaceae bacterium]|nr:inositol monophosphatase family protein [Gaiellaceae bacterium]